MERIIKFRAQDENHCWHFGNYDQDNHEIFYTHIDADGCHKTHIPIVPCTVGQFTGLKDIADQDIYEGDILKDPDDEIFAVYYQGCCWLAGEPYVVESTGLFECNLEEKACQDCKVIGNIFDNPELGGK